MSDWMEELERLADLRDKGLVTEEQFDEQRRRILPSASQPPPPGSSSQQFRDSHSKHEIPKSAKWNLRGLTGFLSSILMIIVLINVWRIVAHAQRWNLVNDILDGKRKFRALATISDLSDTEDMIVVSWGAMMLVSIVWLLLMITWAWRATDNLEHWNINPRWGKGWAIGGWFTPIGLLFIPYHVVSDAWRLAPSKDLSYQPKRNWWWLAGWLSWWIGLFTIYAAFGDLQSPETIRSADIIAIVGICIQIFSALTMTQAINEISQRHTKAALT